MDERMRFVMDRKESGLSMVGLCAAYGISRKTGYKWVRRYESEGVEGLKERSRARKRQERVPEEVARKIVALRRSRPTWGPQKLRARLLREFPGTRWPAASTIGALLGREGLVKRRRQGPRMPGPVSEFRAVKRPNDTWAMDFKGWFRTRDGSRCDPLTISDLYSRYVLACVIVPPDSDRVRPVVAGVLRRYGMPVVIRTDNGPPLGSGGCGGLSQLSVEWVRAGIALERIRPGRPQENGSHERMLKAEATRPAAHTPGEQQERFDRYVRDFNENRPHEALGQRTPAELYRPSQRAYPEELPPVCYDALHQVRRVRTDGSIKWGGRLVFVSGALRGQEVGIAPTTAGDWEVRFADIPLGLVVEERDRLLRYRRGPKRSQASAN